MKSHIASISLSAAVLVASFAFGFRPEAAPQPPVFSAEPYLGEVILFGGSYAPQGWAFCHGQLLAITQHPALYAILGTNFGGNGIQTFGLPDLRGRVPLGAGHGTGLDFYPMGLRGGVERVPLGMSQLPSHNHQLMAHAGLGGNYMPAGLAIASNPRHRTFGPGADLPMHPQAIGTTGSNQPHENRQPFLAMNYIIALEGLFPPHP